MNPIQAHLGPARVIILTTTDAFGSKHVCAPFTTLSLSQSGSPYQPDGTSWVRITNNDNQPQDELVSDWNIRTRFDNGYDGVLLSPYRVYPQAAVEQLATVIVGDTVSVESKAHSATYTATVTAVNADYTIDTTYPAVAGDSGSLVTTPGGVFVGFVSASTGSGSAISIPPAPSFPATLPAFTVIPPASLPVVGVEAQAYARGILEGKRQAIATVQATL